MIAKKVDLTLEQGATFDLTLTWNDLDGFPVPMPSFTAQAMLRKESKNGALAFLFSTSPGLNDGTIILHATNGTVRLTASSDKTATLAEGRYGYDLEITDPGPSPDVVYRLVEGFITVTREATRAA